MPSQDKRLEQLEQQMAPARPIWFYQEDVRASGVFRRHGDVTGRLLTRDEIAADAGPDATAIVLVYVDTPPRIDAPGCPVVLLPDNGRGDLEL